MAVDKLVDSAQLDADLEDIADAIRAKGGTSASLAFPNDFVSAVQAIPTGITPTGTKSITENGTYDVTQYASASVSVPNSYSQSDEGKVVSNGALVAQSSDTVTTNNTYDTTLINSLTVNVSGGGGWTTDGVATGAEPNGAITISSSVSTIKERAFNDCTGITSVTFEGTPYFANYAFNNCTGLTQINAPNLTRFHASNYSPASYTFVGCSGLTSVAFPNHGDYATPNYGFQNCSNLVVADFGGTSKIQNTFKDCTKLRTLVLRKTAAITTLIGWSTNALGGIYSNPTESTIYVPQALISSYQSATNWTSAYAAGVTFAKIEGSQYE